MKVKLNASAQVGRLRNNRTLKTIHLIQRNQNGVDRRGATIGNFIELIFLEFYIYVTKQTKFFDH